MENFATYLPALNALGLISVAVAIFYNQYNSGAKQVSNEVISNYKLLDEQKTKQIADLQKQILAIQEAMRASENRFVERIAKLEGQLREKNHQVESLNQILANRNPELEKLLAEIRDFMQNIYSQNQHQTSILEEAQNRNQVITS
jgi:chromosome segregation ATPase